MAIAVIITASFILSILLFLVIEYSLLIPAPLGIRILMYHKVSISGEDGLTISLPNLERQVKYLLDKGYTPVGFEALRRWQVHGEPLPAKPVILTFDDAYESFYGFVMPLLRKYRLKATVFVPVAFIGKTNAWDQGNDPIMTAEQLKDISKEENISIGLHSFLHQGYADLSPGKMEEDLDNCFTALAFHNIPFIRVLAYPYGAFPKKDPLLSARMKDLFRRKELLFAVRIGNRVNPFNLKDPYTLRRIDIKGTDSFHIFRIKLKKGRKKLFS